MNPQEVFCPNIDCPARGQQGKENIEVHSRSEKRYMCTVCSHTFSASKGTIFYRLRTDPLIVIQVITLLAYGCPMQAIVQAFGLDERTVKKWHARAGAHCQAFHEHMVETSQLDLQQVQADEIKVKMKGHSVWMAMAIMVSTRLWLGGVISEHRDKRLIDELAAKVRKVALCRPLLLAADGLSTYIGAFRRAFRSPLPRHGAAGRPSLVAWPDIVIVQVVKQRSAHNFQVVRRIVQGLPDQVSALIHNSQGGGVINTAYIERLNATFRQRLASLSRRNRCPAQQEATLTAGMYIVGCFYNFCDHHHSLRLRLWITERRHRWVQRTPAMAAALTDHRWSPHELFHFKVPPPQWQPPKRRGRPSKRSLELAEMWAS
ncbi:MAG: IS1 family transposase [Caldilineaceae bacterium]|nr:IS1 family transposase [Caldilineaceae bacterium]